MHAELGIRSMEQVLEVFSRLILGPAKGDIQSHIHVTASSGHVVWLGDPGVQACDVRLHLRPAVVQNNDKLVAAPAAHDICEVARGTEFPGKLFQEQIANEITVVLNNAAESVDVYQHDRKRRAEFNS